MDGWMVNPNLPEWLTNFFIASREIACPHDNLTGELVSEQNGHIKPQNGCMPSYLMSVDEEWDK